MAKLNANIITLRLLPLIFIKKQIQPDKLPPPPHMYQSSVISFEFFLQLQAWRARMQQDPAVQEAATPDEIYQDNYAKRQEGNPQEDY